MPTTSRGHMHRKVRQFADSIILAARSMADRQTGSHAPSTDVNARLFALLQSEHNYRRIWRLASHPMLPPTRRPRRGCVPFLTAALGQVGVEVPRTARIDGLAVARVTLGLARFLEEKLCWRRIERVAALRPGDVIFTRDAPGCPGMPDHVFVFMGWADRTGAVALAVDDQGYTHPRSLFPAPDAAHNSASSAFGFGLRTP